MLLADVRITSLRAALQDARDICATIRAVIAAWLAALLIYLEGILRGQPAEKYDNFSSSIIYRATRIWFDKDEAPCVSVKNNDKNKQYKANNKASRSIFWW